MLSKITQLLPNEVAETVSKLESVLPDILKNSLLKDSLLRPILESAQSEINDASYSASHQGSRLTNAPADTEVSDLGTESDSGFYSLGTGGEGQAGNTSVLERIQGYAASYAQESRNEQKNNASIPQNLEHMKFLVGLEPMNAAGHNPKTYACNICTRKFQSDSGLREHMNATSHGKKSP